MHATGKSARVARPFFSSIAISRHVRHKALLQNVRETLAACRQAAGKVERVAEEWIRTQTDRGPCLGQLVQFAQAGLLLCVCIVRATTNCDFHGGLMWPHCFPNPRSARMGRPTLPKSLLHRAWSRRGTWR